MKYVIALICLVALPTLAQTTVAITVTLSPDQVWALRQDYRDYSADTNNLALTEVQWFRMHATNAILAVADRRLKVRRQEYQKLIADRWPDLTPAQMTNVVNALPPKE